MFQREEVRLSFLRILGISPCFGKKIFFFFWRKLVHVLDRRSEVVIFENLRNQSVFWKWDF